MPTGRRRASIEGRRGLRRVALDQFVAQQRGYIRATNIEEKYRRMKIIDESTMENDDTYKEFRRTRYSHPLSVTLLGFSRGPKVLTAYTAFAMSLVIIVP
jgi:hypothetical protein